MPVHARARALLRSTCNNMNDSIAGRDEERAAIQHFITSFLTATCIEQDETETSLYISGSPGTGKTALVNSILRLADIDASGIKIVSINCMALTSVDALWERLVEEFDGSKRKLAVKSKKAKGKEAAMALLATLNTKW